MATSANRDSLHRLVDEIPDSELHAARRMLQYLRDQSDPLLRALLDAPEDDEPLTEQDAAALEANREGAYIPHEDLKRELGL